MGHPVEHPEQRASDAERESVVRVLARGVADGLLTLDEFADQAAVAYEARTRGELVLALSDLPVANPLALAVPPAPVLADVGPDAPLPKRTWMVAIMGSEERKGRWRAGRRIGAFALMGGVDIDLRDAMLEGDEVEITAWAVMGGVTVIVPEGIPVESSGFILMGGRTNRLADVDPVPGAPVVRVKGYGMWGGVDVKSKPPAGQGRRPRAARTIAPAHAPIEPPPQGAIEQGGLVTVVCTDIVGSTRLADELGDQRWRRVLQAHNALVRVELAAHGGREVKQLGDGFLATFASARRAVRFSMAVQEELAHHRAGHGDAPVEVRVGIHAGDVEREGPDVVGRNVHIACRLCDAAAPSEVLASAVVVDLADSASDVAFGEGRELQLPGLVRPVRAHPVTW